MALWFDIMVNSTSVGRVELVRIDPFGQPAEREMCTYTLRRYDKTGRLAVETTTQYPYITDNPIPLLATALTKIKENYG